MLTEDLMSGEIFKIPSRENKISSVVEHNLWVEGSSQKRGNFTLHWRTKTELANTSWREVKETDAEWSHSRMSGHSGRFRTDWQSTVPQTLINNTATKINKVRLLDHKTTTGFFWTTTKAAYWRSAHNHTHRGRDTLTVEPNRPEQNSVRLDTREGAYLRGLFLVP